MTTYDFGDGNGPVPAHRHTNPDGSVGGWVADTAKVDPTAYVGPHAVVYGNAFISENAGVLDNGRAYGNAMLFEEARVCGQGRVYGEAAICDTVTVLGEISGNVLVTGNITIIGHGEIETRRPKA